MKLSRLSKIKHHRIFRDFVWPGGLPAFAQYNMVYGWNGSGKTTLSSLFACLERKEAITEGEVEFEVDNGAKITGAGIPTANVPPVRVFNREFVARTIESIGSGNVAPIYFLGEESIEQQKQIEQLREELAAANEAVSKASTAKTRADKELDDFCVEKAKLIKEALLGSQDHANYDKRRFREAVARLKSQTPKPASLSETEKQKLYKQKELQAKPSVGRISVGVPDLASVRGRVSELLQRSVVSQVIDNLAKDPAVGDWVQKGLPLHQGERKTDICRFCGNPFPGERRAALEGHFNDAFAAFQMELEEAVSRISRQQSDLEAIAFPDESRFYDHLTEEAGRAMTGAKESIRAVKKELHALRAVLETKKEKPFEAMATKEGHTSDSAVTASLQQAIETINVIIGKHEETTQNLNGEIRQACKALEHDYVLEAQPRFDELSGAATEAEASLTEARRKPAELKDKVSVIERQIVEHRRPAEELDRELRAYLGRDELHFDVKETGYALTRAGKPAVHLSEGERTAIAFLYFLKSLADKGFDSTKGIVVIDDPVSSLDANALFSAFGYMRERTKHCHQLFILTHNFAFFRQVKNWFHHLKGQNKKKVEQRPARFYTLLASVNDGERSATLVTIDPLLEEYESEYHFLFRQVHDVAYAAAPAAELAQYYGMPNIARRLIETFLAYRFPDSSGDLVKRMDRVDFDAAKKTRVLRLLNTYSHSGGISDPEHDPTVLAETQEVMKLILELMNTVDPDHFDGMVNLMTPAEVEEE